MRRKQPAIVAAAVVMVWAGWAPAEAPRKVAGKVFLDANGNGKCDPGEPGIAGVRITDSVKFVVTGPDGAYRIGVSDDPMFPCKGSQVVSVSWPSGKWPTGQWWARLDQIADARAVHFGLREDKQDRPFLFAHITDDHSNGVVVENYGRNFPHMAEALQFVFETGDMGYATPEGAEKTFTDIVKNGRTLPVPIFYLPGNHDYVAIHSQTWTKQDPMYGGGAYTRHLGPVRWSFDYGQSHFVGIDWVTPQGDKLECGLPGVAMEFLKRDLALAKKGAAVFVFVHFPNIPAGALMPEKFSSVSVFGGHSHQFAHWGGGKVTYTTQIALWGAGGCGLVHVAGKDVEFLYRCAGCKWGDWKGMAQRGAHLNFCPMFGFAYRLMPEVEKTRQPVTKVAVSPLAGSRAIDAGPLAGKSAEIELDIAPGSAKQIGLKIHGDQRTLTVAWDGQWLTCDGIRVPMPLREWEEAVRMRLIADGSVVRMQVNGMYEIARPLATTTLKAEAFAVGGQARLEKFDVYRYELDKAAQSRPVKARAGARVR
jgi:hypothetical protein